MLQNLQEQYPKANEGDLGQHLDDPEWVKKRTQNLEMELEKIERQAHGRRDELEVKDNMLLHPFHRPCFSYWERQATVWREITSLDSCVNAHVHLLELLGQGVSSYNNT